MADTETDEKDGEEWADSEMVVSRLKLEIENLDRANAGRGQRIMELETELQQLRLSRADLKEIFVEFEEIIEVIFLTKGQAPEQLPGLMKRIRWKLGELVLMLSEENDPWLIRLLRRRGPVEDLVKARLDKDSVTNKFVQEEGVGPINLLEKELGPKTQLAADPDSFQPTLADS